MTAFLQSFNIFSLSYKFPVKKLVIFPGIFPLLKGWKNGIILKVFEYGVRNLYTATFGETLCCAFFGFRLLNL